MKHKLLLLYTWLVRTLFFFFPDMPFCMRLRGFFYGLGMKKCGKNFQATHNAIIRCLENIEIGRDVYFANNVLVLATGLLKIGDEAMLGPNVVVVNHNHSLSRGSYRYEKEVSVPITIGAGSWVAANAVIVRGGSLPKASLLASNSVLNKSFQHEGVVLGGLPAKFIQTAGKNTG